MLVHTLSPIKACLWACMLLTVVGCSTQAVENPAQKTEEIRPVRAEQIVFAPITKTQQYSGEVQARVVTQLGFRVAGKVIERKVDVGSVVKKGQLLARIDRTDYQLNLLSGQAEVKAAEADYTKAASDLQRYQSLMQKGVISRNEYDAYVNRVNTTKARLNQARAGLEVKENQATYTQLVADVEGVVTQVNAEVGQVVEAGQPIVQVARPQEREIAIDVPENQLEHLQTATEITVRLWAYPQQTWQGTVREIAPNANPATRTYSVRISVLAADARVHLGMTATVTIQRQSSEAVALVPLTAIYAQKDKPAVWVIHPETQAVQLTAVQLGDFRDNQAAIIAGVEKGQWIVTAGTHKLHDGQRVKRLES